MAGGGVFYFSDFKLETGERRLTRAGRPIALAPKAHEVLAVLVRNAGQLVSKHQLLESVWPGQFVEESILAVHISALRKALGEGGERHIETVPKAGYRFTADVRSAAPAAEQRRWTLAVLPGRPLTREALTERDRATGLTFADALTDRLGSCHGVIVRPTRAVRAYYANGVEDTAAVGRSLEVDAVIESHLISSAERVEISVHLVRSSDGEILWTGKYDECPAGVVGIVDAVAEGVLSRVGLPSAARRSGTPRRASDPVVYELFGRGRLHLLAASMFEIRKALESFRAAIERDPTYAPAHAGLALAYCGQAAFRAAPAAKAYGEARIAALRALALDDSSADAQTALGSVMFFSEWDWIGAERSLLRALELNPNHSEAYLIYGQLLEALGRLEEGLGMKMRALERDPFSPLVLLQISMSYWHQRRYDDVIHWARKALEIDAQHPHAREMLSAAYLMMGDFAGYGDENVRHAEVHGATAETLEQVKRVGTPEGRAAMIRQVLERASEQPNSFPEMQLALFQAESGDMDAAFQHLERAIESHDPCLVHLGVAPQWDRLRNDPRFSRYLARMGLPLQAGSSIG